MASAEGSDDCPWAVVSDDTDFAEKYKVQCQNLKRMQEMMDGVLSQLETQGERIVHLNEENQHTKNELARLKDELARLNEIKSIIDAASNQDWSEEGQSVYVSKSGQTYHKIGSGGCHHVQKDTSLDLSHIPCKYAKACGRNPCKLCYPMPMLDLGDDGDAPQGHAI